MLRRAVAIAAGRMRRKHAKVRRRQRKSPITAHSGDHVRPFPFRVHPRFWCNWMEHRVAKSYREHANCWLCRTLILVANSPDLPEGVSKGYSNLPLNRRSEPFQNRWRRERTGNSEFATNITLRGCVRRRLCSKRLGWFENLSLLAGRPHVSWLKCFPAPNHERPQQSGAVWGLGFTTQSAAEPNCWGVIMGLLL